MNKKGFTLVELVISIALLSVVMVFLLNFLELISNEDDGVEKETLVQLDKMTVSKTINEDLHSDSISTLTCTSNACTITTVGGKTKKLSLNDNLLLYEDITSEKTKVILKRKLSVDYKISSEEKTYIRLITLTDETNADNNITFISKKS
ncbi:MAG: prepilin-type N-terminal cleavage/methylation domain-containing protein [Tenericutes bacterium]|nr:prepilin-type N-terminal cleavage/methylation domain-containing protein [Mycoplasmatota bacterium]